MIQQSQVTSERRSDQVRFERGFTLIELMITVAIIALLAAIAYPAYTDSILKGRRAEGRTALMELLQQQERYLTQSGSYMTWATAGATGTNGTTQGGTNVQIPFKTTSGNGASGAYRLLASVCTPASGPVMARNECVLLTATPTSSDPAFGNLTLMSTGAKGCSTGNAKCWR